MHQQQPRLDLMLIGNPIYLYLNLSHRFSFLSDVPCIVANHTATHPEHVV